MCHRHLTFKKSSICGHLILTDSQNIDCEKAECYNSSAHPPDCAAQKGSAHCLCRRYYTQPNRVVNMGQLPTQCPSCSSRPT